MHRYLVLGFAVFLSGCLSSFGVIPQETKNRLHGQSISVVETRLGPASRVNSTPTGQQYSWVRSDTQWTTIASSQKIAGTRMVNGRNVATIVNGPPIRTLQTVTCSLYVMTDKQGKITDMSLSGGGSCSNLADRL